MTRETYTKQDIIQIIENFSYIKFDSESDILNRVNELLDFIYDDNYEPII